jgi:hypothetical protein
MTKILMTALLFMAMTATAGYASNLFPLSSGNSWIYRDATTGHTFEVRVSLPIVTNDHTYHSLTGFGPVRLMARINEFGNLVYWDEDLGMELIITSFETGAVGDFEAYGRQCATWGRTLQERRTSSGPAGSWTVVQVDYQPYRCADAGDLSEQYAENIGMVQRVVNTIAGPRTYDLVYARVGSQVIEAGERGRFNVGVLPGPDSNSWDVTLRVDPTSAAGIHVRFPTSQEYDLRLRDQQGTILWTWSADKFFLQAEHVRQNIAGWTATVRVPHPFRTPEEIHYYTLEGWLTTAPGEMQFAAAASISLLPAIRPAAD